MNRPAAKGWCPSVLRPMKSGDGLLVRIKPNYGLLNANQLLVLADCLDDFGNGLLDVTSRTNLQIRGVKEQGYSDLVIKLQTEGLVGVSEKLDRLNVIVPPFIQKNSLTWRCASQIYSSAESLPFLPEAAKSSASSALSISTLLSEGCKTKPSRGGILAT